MSGACDKPSWNRLYEIASAQQGYFSTQQAAGAGYSSQLLGKHLRSGRVMRARRGVYRLVHFPPGDHEELVTLWLWSEQAGVFSHQTALALHELSDVLPARVHLTLPLSWQARRLRVPPGVRRHHAELPPTDRAWIGAVPVTTPGRTLLDMAAGPSSPEVLHKALDDARARGLLAAEVVEQVARALGRFGGHAA